MRHRRLRCAAHDTAFRGNGTAGRDGCVAWERQYRSRYANRIRRLKTERDPGGGPPVVVVSDLEAERVVEFRLRQRLIVADVTAEADVAEVGHDAAAKVEA